MPRSQLFLLALASAALFASCSGPRAPLERDLPSAFPHHSAVEIRYQLTEALDTLTGFRAKSNLMIRAPENSGSFSAELQERRGDSLYVSISPGLGIEAARALVTPDSFYFYDRLKNRLLYGALSEAEGLLPEPFTSGDIGGNLLGLPVPAPEVDWTVDADEEYYYLSNPAGHVRYVVDPAYWRVIQYEERNGSGQLVERRVFSEFDEFDGVVLPRRLVFERPMDGRTASIYYRSLTLNPRDLHFALKVRDSAARIRVGG